MLGLGANLLRQGPKRGNRDLGGVDHERRASRYHERTLGGMGGERAAELEAQLGALRAGFWLGWLSIVAVIAGLALGLHTRHPAVLVGLTAAAAAANAAVTLVPWRRWLEGATGRLLLDLWSGGLIAFAGALVMAAGARAGFDLLLFLIAPFLATAHRSWRRVAWLAIAATSYSVMMAAAPAPLATGEVLMRLALLAAATTLALALARMVMREASARARASERAELEHALLAESHHRVKNSLQTVADILMLGRPAGPGAEKFDETAARIRSIAAVHRLLAERRGEAVSAPALLTAVAAAAAVDAQLDAEPRELSPTHAQQLGIVVNELISNAARHGRPPVHVSLHGNAPALLEVRDAGDGPRNGTEQLGLQLVRQIVEHGLAGTFTLSAGAPAGTCAQVRFDPNRCGS
jgi:two-component sensor histidine kinase